MSGIRMSIPIRNICSPNESKVVTGRLVLSLPDDSTRLSSNMAVLPGKLPLSNRHRNHPTMFPVISEQLPIGPDCAKPSPSPGEVHLGLPLDLDPIFLPAILDMQPTSELLLRLKNRCLLRCQLLVQRRTPGVLLRQRRTGRAPSGK